MSAVEMRVSVEIPMVAFKVFGQPAPQGSKRHVGNGVMIESSKAVKPWRQDVVAAGREAMGDRPALDGPLAAVFVFTLPKPKSAPKRRVTYPDRKPDLSKLLRSTEDALVTAGVIADDARLVSIGVTKCYPGEHEHALPSPGAYIAIMSLDREQYVAFQAGLSKGEGA